MQADENIAPSKQVLHQRHKSTGTLSTMLGAGGLKAAAKRTAFGDVSNLVKHAPTHDGLNTSEKNNGFEVLQKPGQTTEKSAGFLRPAQRPITTASLKGILGNNIASSISTVGAGTKPQASSVTLQHQSQKLRTLQKRATVTTIFKDSNALEQEQVQVHLQTQNTDAAPVVPVHQTLAPRQYKSQPQLNVEAPSLRRKQSRNTSAIFEEVVNQFSAAPVPAEEPTNEQTDTDAPSNDYEPYPSLLNRDYENGRSVNDAYELDEEENDKEERHLPPLPPVSEPEEYWEEEEEDEIYDEQGYTTAHSYRSRGDNTTGGATTVLFPKVTNKVKKELALAKDLVESSRTQDEIEDEAWDTSMVAEYGDEIFSYMRELEVSRVLFTNNPSL